MKRIIMLILTVIAMFAICITGYAEDVSEETPDNTVILDASKIGDANNDSKISAADARTVLRISAKLEKTPDEWIYLDINADKKLSAADARILLRISAKLDSIDNYSDCVVNGHELDEKVIEPTCTNEGYTTLGCTRCSYTENVKVNIQPKKEHSFKKGSVIKGTCVSDGYTEYKCSTCGTVEKRDITKAGGHKYELISEKRITENGFDGFKEQKVCKYCNNTITTYTTTNANYQIPTVPISSDAAKNIQKKFERYGYTVEGHDITGKKVVIYGNMDGIDIDGYFYNLDGTLMSKCERCGKTAGLGEGMCNLLFCGISFN